MNKRLRKDSEKKRGNSQEARFPRGVTLICVSVTVRGDRNSQDLTWLSEINLTETHNKKCSTETQNVENGIQMFSSLHFMLIIFVFSCITINILLYLHSTEIHNFHTPSQTLWEGVSEICHFRSFLLWHWQPPLSGVLCQAIITWEPVGNNT